MKIRKMMKRIAALVACSMLFGLLLSPLMGIQAYAGWDKDSSSDTLYRVVDGSEKKNSFSISYNVTSGHKLNNFTSGMGWNAEMDAKAGDKIVIEYTVHYPQSDNYTTISNPSVYVSGTSTAYGDGGVGSTETVLFKQDLPASDGSTGVLELDIPADSNFAHCAIISKFDYAYVVNGVVQQSGPQKLSFYVDINVEGGVDTGYTETETEQSAEAESGEDEGAEIREEIVETKPASKPKPDDKTDGNTGGNNGGSNVTKPKNKRTSAPVTVGVTVGGAIVGAGVGGLFGGGGPGGGGAGSGPGNPGGGAGSTPRGRDTNRDTGRDDRQQGEDEDERKKRYKMFISKDFGDAIRKGAAPVIVRARIMEISGSGVRKARPDLTERITVTGENLQTGRISMNGTWAEAQVYAEEENPYREGKVVFTFNGEGGLFHNRIVFRLVGKPYIVYPDSDISSTEMSLKMISSDPNPYSARFLFEDAVGEPQKLLVSGGSRFTTKVREAEYLRTYYADVALNYPTDSAPLYTAPEREYISIHAEFANGDVVDGGFYAELWPEGLSVSSRHIRNGCLEINTEANQNAGSLDYQIRPTEFEVRLAYREADGRPAFLTGKKLKARFSGLYDVERYGHTFTDNFKYKIDTQYDIWSFDPEHTLPMPEAPYDALMDVECEAGGQLYKEALTLKFFGEKPVPPDDWGKEWELLKKTIWNYGISPDCMWIRDWIRNAKDHTPNELSMLRYHIIKQAVAYYQKEAMEFNEMADSFERWETSLGIVKWIGDQSFSYLITVYGGGPFVEAFASPLKDMFAEFAGVYAGAMLTGEKVVYEESNLYAALLQGVENTLGEVLTGDSPPTPQKIGYVIAGFIFVSFTRHYYYGENEAGDIYKSMLAACGDLSGAFIKQYAGDWFKQYLKNDKGFGNKLGTYLRGKFDFDADFNHVDAVSKYVTETIGLVGGWIYDTVTTTPTPLNPAAGLMEGAKFEDNSWTVRLEFKGGYTVVIPLIDNIGVIVDLVYESIFKFFGDNAKPVPVNDYLVNQK